MLIKREAGGKVSKVATGEFAEPQSELIARLLGSRSRPIGVPYTLYYHAPFTLALAASNEAAVTVVETNGLGLAWERVSIECQGPLRVSP